MEQRDRDLYVGLALSGMLALAAYATNGASGWLLPRPRSEFLILSVAASLAWATCSAILINRFSWRGAVSLLGAPLALALPVFYLLYRDTLVWGCTFQDVCP